MPLGRGCIRALLSEGHDESPFRQKRARLRSQSICFPKCRYIRNETHIRPAGTVLVRSEYALPPAAWELTPSHASSCVAPRQTDELRSSFRDAQASRYSERRMNINEGCRSPGGCSQIDQTDRPRQKSMASKPFPMMHASRTPQCCQPASDPYDMRIDFQAHCDITLVLLASATVAFSCLTNERRPMLPLHFSTARSSLLDNGKLLACVASHSVSSRILKLNTSI